MFCNHIRRGQPLYPKEAPKLLKAKHPTIRALFQKTYKCLMRAGDIVSIEEIREEGHLRIGNKRADSAHDRNIQYIHLKVPKMVEHFINGTPFHICSAEDTRFIFEAICDHTSRWRDLLKFGYNVGSAPAEDLINLELFAEAIYRLARHDYNKINPSNSDNDYIMNFLYHGNGLEGLYSSGGKLSTSALNDYSFNVKNATYRPDIELFKEVLVKQSLKGIRS